MWLIKQLPQYRGKWVFQRRAKLTIFTMNGNQVLVCYGERQVLLFNLQRLSILAKKG
jgi:hypothetical protein